MRGSYVLLLKLPEEQNIPVGSLKTVRFPEGYYAYVGSALNGLESRVRRHLSHDKKLHWHIDYLLPEASITDIVFAESDNRAECAIAQALNRQFDSIRGFGSSDCRCPSHLFSADDNDMKSKVLAVLSQLKIKTGSLSEVVND